MWLLAVMRSWSNQAMPAQLLADQHTHFSISALTAFSHARQVPRPSVHKGNLPMKARWLIAGRSFTRYTSSDKHGSTRVFHDLELGPNEVREVCTMQSRSYLSQHVMLSKPKVLPRVLKKSLLQFDCNLI